MIRYWLVAFVTGFVGDMLWVKYTKAASTDSYWAVFWTLCIAITGWVFLKIMIDHTGSFTIASGNWIGLILGTALAITWNRRAARKTKVEESE